LNELQIFLRRGLDRSLLSKSIVLDYTDISLKKIDDCFSMNLKKDFENIGIHDVELHELLSMYLGIGSYFGEVIIQNIGGEWIIPSRWKYWRARIAGDYIILFNNWYIYLKGHQIPVMNIAKGKLDGSGRVKSLYEAYKKIESRGKWSESDYDES